MVPKSLPDVILRPQIQTAKKMGSDVYKRQNEYYPKLAGELFELIVELKEKTGCDIRFVNLSGGVGIPYTCLLYTSRCV